MARSGSIMLPIRGRTREWILHEVAEDCNRAPEDQWRGIIRASLHDGPRPPDLAGIGNSSFNIPDEDDGDLADVDALRIQIHASGTIMGDLAGDELLARPLGAGFREVLVEDLGGGEVALSRSRADELERDDAELWKIARKNTVASELHQSVVQPIGSFEITVSNGFYLAAFVLATLEQLDAPAGVLVVLLSWHHVITHPVGPQTDATTIETMRTVARDLNDKIDVQPIERLCPDVLLWRRDQPLAVVSSWPP